MKKVRLIEPGFSTADAEYPEIKQEDGDLVLRYKNWKEELVEVFFAESIAFKWQMAETFLENERDDSSYIIENSNWLELHIKQGEVAQGEVFFHYKFNFNGIGQLEVLAQKLTVKT